jgi:hypothetical protein
VCSATTTRHEALILHWVGRTPLFFSSSRCSLTVRLSPPLYLIFVKLVVALVNRLSATSRHARGYCRHTIRSNVMNRQSPLRGSSPDIVPCTAADQARRGPPRQAPGGEGGGSLLNLPLRVDATSRCAGVDLKDWHQ